MSEETIHVEEDVIKENGHKRSWTEEISVAGDEVVGKVQELLREATVRRITIKDEHGKKLISFPMYAGVAGMLILGPWSALALIGAWVAKFSILIEREEPVHAAEAEAAEDGSDDLTAIAGVGPSRAERMNEVGINTYADLAAMTPAELAELIGISESQAEKFVVQAQELTGA